jgi:hypothetical protein
MFCFAGRLSPQARLVITASAIFGSRLRRHHGGANVAFNARIAMHNGRDCPG